MNWLGSPLDVFRLVPDGDPGTDLPGKSGTVRVRLSRVRGPIGADWSFDKGVFRKASLLLNNSIETLKKHINLVKNFKVYLSKLCRRGFWRTFLSSGLHPGRRCSWIWTGLVLAALPGGRSWLDDDLSPLKLLLWRNLGRIPLPPLDFFSRTPPAEFGDPGSDDPDEPTDFKPADDEKTSNSRISCHSLPSELDGRCWTVWFGGIVKPPVSAEDEAAVAKATTAVAVENPTIRSNDPSPSPSLTIWYSTIFHA